MGRTAPQAGGLVKGRLSKALLNPSPPPQSHPLALTSGPAPWVGGEAVEVGETEAKGVCLLVAVASVEGECPGTPVR